MSPRWLSPLVLAAAIAFAALAAGDARAQVFRPRGAKGAVIAKAAPVAAAAPTAAKKAPVAEAPATSASKAPARGTPRRAGAAKKRRKPRGNSDDVKIDDDSDEDVKITDD